MTNHEGAWRWLIPSLESSTDISGLEELTLQAFRSKSNGEVSLEDDSLYQMLDEALSHPRFACLLQVTLHISASFEEWMGHEENLSDTIHNKMPHLSTLDRLVVLLPHPFDGPENLAECRIS